MDGMFTAKSVGLERKLGSDVSFHALRMVGLEVQIGVGLAFCAMVLVGLMEKLGFDLAFSGMWLAGEIGAHAAFGDTVTVRWSTTCCVCPSVRFKVRSTRKISSSANEREIQNTTNQVWIS